jgi:hypothetical protein
MFSIPCNVSRLGLLGAGASAVAGASVLTDAMVVVMVLVSGASDAARYAQGSIAGSPTLLRLPYRSSRKASVWVGACERANAPRLTLETRRPPNRVAASTLRQQWIYIGSLSPRCTAHNGIVCEGRVASHRRALKSLVSSRHDGTARRVPYDGLLNFPCARHRRLPGPRPLAPRCRPSDQ